MTTDTRDQRWIQQAEVARDLKTQLADIANEDESEIQFTEWSPGRKYVHIWSMTDGEEAVLPRYQALAALNIRRPDGAWAWTTDPANAPKPRVNSVKCFLHPEAPERALLDEIGITKFCMSGQLASNSSKRQHAMRRHSAEWAQYQEEVQTIERRKSDDRQERQLEAMLAMAGQREAPKAARAKPEREAVDYSCDVCGFQTTSNIGLVAHKRTHNKEA